MCLKYCYLLLVATGGLIQSVSRSVRPSPKMVQFNSLKFTSHRDQNVPEWPLNCSGTFWRLKGSNIQVKEAKMLKLFCSITTPQLVQFTSRGTGMKFRYGMHLVVADFLGSI